MTKFSSNRPVKSTLIAGQNLVKPALSKATLFSRSMTLCSFPQMDFAAKNVIFC